MNKLAVRDIIDQEAAARTLRQPLSAMWRDVVNFVAPAESYAWADVADGKRPDIVDDSAAHAIDVLVGALDDMLFGDKPYEVVPRFDDAPPELVDWCADASVVMAKAINHPLAAFVAARHQALHSVTTIGTCVMQVTERPGEHLLFVPVSIGRVSIAESASGVVDTFFVRSKMSAAQMADEYGADKLGSAASNALQSTDRWAVRFNVLIACMPRAEAARLQGVGSTAMPFASYHIDVDSDGGTMLRESGYEECPFIGARWRRLEGLPYGWSNVMTSIHDVKRMNNMKRTNLRAAHAAVDPAIVLPYGIWKNTLDRTPGAVNQYDPQEAPRGVNIQQFPSGAALPITIDMEQELRDQLRSVFAFHSIVVPPTPQMTATEYAGRQRELARLLHHAWAMIQTELAEPVGRRAYAILARRGVFAPMPEGATEADVKVEFKSPLKRAAEMNEADSVLRVMQAIGAMAQFDPSIIKIVSPDAAVRIIRKGYGAPPEMLLSQQEFAEVRAADQQAAQAQQMMSALQQGGEAAQSIGAGLQAVRGET